MRIRTKPAVNIQKTSSQSIARYEQEIALLKQELAFHDAIVGRTGVRYGPMTERELRHANQDVEEFLRQEDSDMKFQTVRHAQCMFACLRTMLRAAARTNGGALPQVPGLSLGSETHSHGDTAGVSHRSRGGTSARQPTAGDGGETGAAVESKMSVAGGATEEDSQVNGEGAPGSDDCLDYEAWKAGPGEQYVANFTKVKGNWKARKAVTKTCARAINAAKE